MTITKLEGGGVMWDDDDFVEYHATGVLTNGEVVRWWEDHMGFVYELEAPNET